MANELVPRRNINEVVLRPNYAAARQVQRETLTFRHTQLVYRNFTGKEGPYNAEGERSFSILLDEELANELMAAGMNVKPMSNRDDDGDDQMYHLPVSVSYKKYPPRVYMVTGVADSPVPLRKTLLPEESLMMMDNLELSETHLIVSVYNYEVRGTKGKKAYLQSLFGHAKLDELEQEYANVEDMLLQDIAEHKVVDTIEGEFRINE